MVTEKKLSDRKYDEIKYLLNNINLKVEKAEMLKNFDKVFLNLFPHFIYDFNSLFNEEERIYPDKDELLNTDLRIFALMKMGITNNEKIAQILGYSVNTIYAYKTKIKKKSNVSSREFDELFHINNLQ
jgi:DNA-binding NarL/FixJ family response regulator